MGNATAICDIIRATAGQVEDLNHSALSAWQQRLVKVVAAALRCMADVLQTGLAEVER